MTRQSRVAEFEARLLKAVLIETEGNVTAAAKELGISRSTIYRMIRRSARTVEG